MPKIEASKLNRSLKQVLEGVAEGKTFELTRYGKVVAKIVPPSARGPRMITPSPLPKLEDAVAEVKHTRKPEPTPDQIRAKRREFLMRRIDRS
jgi:antitoxin (DNA-binding transcriptional repressor) of toxin-antitoxin stability system